MLYPLSYEGGGSGFQLAVRQGLPKVGSTLTDPTEPTRSLEA
jgi:hypothetical protein